MAKKFDFRLEPILKLRTHFVNKAKDDLNQVVVLKMQKELQIKEKESYFSEILTTKNGTLKASELQTSIHHRELVIKEIKKLHRENQNLVEIENLKRNKLSHALQEEKVLENLKEKRYGAYKDEINKEETIRLDEIAQSKHQENKFKI